MRQDFGPGAGRYEIFEWSDRTDDDTVEVFQRASDGSALLQRHANDASLMGWLRTWASRDGVPDRSDAGVLAAAGFALRDSRLMIVEMPWRFRWLIGVQGVSTASSPRPKGKGSGLFTAPPPAARSQAPAPAKEAPPKPISTDKQVAALLSAAKNGAPFCEQCSKADA